MNICRGKYRINMIGLKKAGRNILIPSSMVGSPFYKPVHHKLISFWPSTVSRFQVEPLPTVDGLGWIQDERNSFWPSTVSRFQVVPFPTVDGLGWIQDERNSFWLSTVSTIQVEPLQTVDGLGWIQDLKSQ